MPSDPVPREGERLVDRESFLEGFACAREGAASDPRAEAEGAWRLAWGDAPGDLRGAYRLAQQAHMETVGELANLVSRAEATEARADEAEKERDEALSVIAGLMSLRIDVRVDDPNGSQDAARALLKEREASNA